ncbi:DUF4142 domain-containing protein [Rhodospirillum centenum]|uniref:DUF4142 domain-containing protein n=1 Tax=Rhodospirillum centenum (strain ATCC 51521 / SW) TaxID=414684 RepID=B6IUM5_RHOCS|nr:DUF4142 domain-containing protein [Rhodospirillum centenum]ACI99850.1 conserved hypothetical protein [Rhodospirillum centenum SW]
MRASSPVRPIRAARPLSVPVLILAALLAGPASAAQASDPVPGAPAQAPATELAAEGPLADAVRGSLYAAESARLAQERSDTEEVQEIASDILDSHTMLLEDLGAEAVRLGVVPPADPGVAPAAMLVQLRQAADEDFDTLWLTQQIDAHERLVALYRAAAAPATADGPAPALPGEALARLEDLLARLRDAAGVGVAGRGAD